MKNVIHLATYKAKTRKVAKKLAKLQEYWLDLLRA